MKEEVKSLIWEAGFLDAYLNRPFNSDLWSQWLDYREGWRDGLAKKE